MEKIYIKNIKIEKVRHLENINICIGDECKNLILTGKNGSGKTSLLNALAAYINSAATNDGFISSTKMIDHFTNQLVNIKKKDDKNQEKEIYDTEKYLQHWNEIRNKGNQGAVPEFNISDESYFAHFQKNEFIIALYKAEREFKAQESKHIEKVEFKERYSMEESPRNEFIKYLADLNVTEALARNKGNTEKADKIRTWFDGFKNLLRELFDDETTDFEIDDDSFKIQITQANKEQFDFNQLSSGYGAILDIVVDLIMRMEKKNEHRFVFDMPGIVLIDEIESHLHLELQKRIMSFLTKIFPNIQFIVSTHSPFVLNATDNVVIFDLQTLKQIDGGLTDYTYSGIVDGYFEVDEKSAELNKYLEEYKSYVEKKELCDEDFSRIAVLEKYLDEIPDFLEPDVSMEFKEYRERLKNRSDI